MLTVRCDEYPRLASHVGTKGGTCSESGLSPTLTLERLVHTQHQQKALEACKPLESFEQEAGLLRDRGPSRACSHQVLGLRLDGKLFVSVHLFAKSQLWAMPKISGGKSPGCNSIINN